MNHHSLMNVLDYAAFYVGMFLFMLRRADLAMHAVSNALKSRKQYFALNWVTLVIRSVMQTPIVYVWHHYTIADLVGWFGSSWKPSATIPDIPGVALLLGYFSYTGLDWLIAKRAPSWVREQIPMLPNGAGPHPLPAPDADGNIMGTMKPAIVPEAAPAPPKV